MCMTRAVSSRVQCTKGRRTEAFCWSYTQPGGRYSFGVSVLLDRSEARGGSLDCREGGSCWFNNFQKSSSLYRRRLHANVGHPISARTDTFDFVRRLLVLHVILLLQPKAGVFQLADSLPGCRNPRRVQRTPVPAELDLCRDACLSMLAEIEVDSFFLFIENVWWLLRIFCLQKLAKGAKRVCPR